jgi:hypothetical protein
VQYERLVQELELRREIQMAEQELAKGETVSHEHVEARILELARHLDGDG